MSQYPLRLPKSLLDAARRISKDEEVSMNQLFATAIAEKISALDTERLLRERIAHGNLIKYRRVLSDVSQGSPIHEDDRPD
ncbi:MAG: toxin-antitoxin system HicB family antitoxin [Magnetococcales bacterium]|nr:toxin-antitoxin system HicB family antitoxin [Magnetococcales bacterium]